MAEKTALINRITAWVIDNGIAQAARWQQQGLDFNLALNVSAADLDRPALPTCCSVAWIATSWTHAGWKSNSPKAQ